MDLKRLSVSLVLLGNAVLAALIVFFSWSLTPAQTAASYTEVTVAVGLGVALYAHFRPTQPRYPVAVGVAFIAFTSSSFTALTLFGTWGFNDAKAVAAQSVVVALVSVVTLFVATSKVTPEADARAREQAAIASSRRRPPTSVT